MDTLFTIMPYAIGLCGLAVLCFIGTIWGLMLLGIAGSMLKACWKVARRVWKWASRQLRSAPEAQAVSEPHGKPQAEPKDTRPLTGARPNWQKPPTEIAVANKTLSPETPAAMPPIYF
jgi:hypothetical protein